MTHTVTLPNKSRKSADNRISFQNPVIYFLGVMVDVGRYAIILLRACHQYICQVLDTKISCQKSTPSDLFQDMTCGSYISSYLI